MRVSNDRCCDDALASRAMRRSSYRERWLTVYPRFLPKSGPSSCRERWSSVSLCFLPKLLLRVSRVSCANPLVATAPARGSNS